MDKQTVAVGRDLNRVPLHSVVPRSVPFAIGIAPSDICNFHCKYCNQATENGIRDARIVPFEDFLGIVTQIEELLRDSSDRLKIIRFIGNGEPLVNKKTPDMVKYVADRNLADRYEVTTNGSLLTHAMADQLIEAGLTRLLVSVQGVTKEKYKDVCGFNIDYEQFVEQLTYFYEKSRGRCKVGIKTVNVAISSDEEEKNFFDIFSPICDEISVENIIASNEDVDYSTMLTEAEMGLARYNVKLEPKICCDTLFMYMNIHSNGDVDACGCVYPPLYLGNVYNMPIRDIWNGKKHKEIMMKHLTGRRCDISKCAECVSIDHQNGFEQDNLDPYLDEILERVSKL